MKDQFFRTRLMVGDKGIARLQNATVAILGLGAVGSFCLEILARSGVGNFIIADKDQIEITNLNRQIYALNSTIDKDKTAVAAERIKDINARASVKTITEYIHKGNVGLMFDGNPDVVVDAADIINTKIALIAKAQELSVPIVCSMGAGLKTDLSKIKTTTIKKTKNCPLAFVLRKKLRQERIDTNVPCVYSEELPVEVGAPPVLEDAKEYIGTMPYITACFGLHLAKLTMDALLAGK